MDQRVGPGFLADGGEMGALIRAHGWSATPLGDPSTWPQSLRSALSICLNSRLVSALYWGPEFRLLYNDAYAAALAERHPGALGRSVGDVWAEIWDVLGPQLRSVVETGQGFATENQRLLMKRRGHLEETFWVYSLTPIRGEADAIVGIFLTAMDNTNQVLAERRRAFLSGFEEKLSDLADPRKLMAAAARALGEHLGAGCVGYAEADASGERVAVERDWVAEGAVSVAGTHRLDDYGPAMIAALKAGRTVPVEDVARDPMTSGATDAYAAIRTRSFVDAPLVKAGRLAAILFVLCEKPRAWTADEVALIEAAAERTWAAVERARAEAALRESEDNYRHAVDLSPQTVWTARPDGQLDHVGSRWREWTGTSGLGSSWGDAVHPDDLAPSVEAWTRAVSTGEPYDIEHRVRFRDGSYRWMHSRAYPRRDERGGIARWYGTTEDIHAARIAEEALRESEARFRNMADHAPVMMWVTDPSGHCTYLNRRWYEFTGQDVEESLGLGWTKATHPDDEKLAEEAFLSANAARAPFRVEYRLRRTDGAYRWAIDAASPRFGEDGAFLGYVGSVIDIDDRKRAEARRLALLELNDRIRDLDDPADLSFAAAEILGRALGVSRAGYGTIDTTAETITVERDWNAPGIRSLAGVLHFRDYGSYIEDLKRGETVVFADAEKDSRTAARAEALKAISAQSVVNMPVTEQGGLVALLYLNHATAREWPADELAFVREVAERTRVAVERRRAERELRESEAEARNLAAQQAATLGQLAEGVIVTDAGGRITLINDAAVRLHGVKRLDVAPDDYTATYSLLTDDGHSYPSLDLPLARAVRGETVREARWRIRRPDGSQVLAVGNAKPVLDGAGRQIGAVLTIRDDTARRVAEEKLERLNSALEETVAERTRERDRVWQNSRDLLVVVGADSVFRAVNPAWTAILGHAPAEVVGRSFLDFVWPDDAEATRGGLAAAARSDLTDFENRYRHKDGAPRWISWRTSAEGGLVYAYGRDVTAEKEQAEALRRAEDQLRQSQKMEAVGQLTGGIAHDFNNLLTGITGSLEMLNTRISQGRIMEVDRYVTAAQGAAKRAAALTHRLLAFSRRQTLDPKPTDLNRLIAGMEELVRRTVGPEVAVEVVAAGGLWATLVDPNQLENALLNLCINARDAMPEGGRLTIETANRWLDARAARERDLSPGQYVSLCVSDTGAGMTPEIAERAFDPFFTTKPLGMGTGLGLSMIYGFVRQSGGQARIYSEPGHGALVCLYLPRHVVAEGGADGPAETGPEAPPRAEQGETVLVVDDEPSVRMLIAEVLEDLGYTAIEAADGASGLKALRSGARVDLLVTDVGLPGGMNGRQLADAARQARPGLKVLFITGYAENAVLNHGHLDPGMHVLTKPFAMEALASRIKNLIAGT